jgi:hypothetical protein
MSKLLLLLSLFLSLLLSSAAQQLSRRVENSVLISESDPLLKMAVAKELAYIGRVPFQLRPIAAGERHVFAELNAEKRIIRMLVVQFEGMLPGINDWYRFGLGRTPIRLGRHDYKHNLWTWNNAENIKQQPNNEAAAMQKFLDAKGIKLDDELVMSRFARPVGEDKRHEIIIFYIEPLAPYGYKVSDFDWEKPLEGKQAEWEKQYREKSLKMFSVAE